jgi:hypothetical protein
MLTAKGVTQMGKNSRTPSELQALDYHKMTLATVGCRNTLAF